MGKDRLGGVFFSALASFVGWRLCLGAVIRSYGLPDGGAVGRYGWALVALSVLWTVLYPQRGSILPLAVLFFGFVATAFSLIVR